MKKIYTTLVAALIGSCLISGSSLDKGKLVRGTRTEKANASSELSTLNKAAVESESSVSVRPLRSPDPDRASVDRKSVILYEDFDLVPDGATEQIGNLGDRYIDFIASRHSEPGRYISNDYTPESGTWEGDWVYAGKNGTVILQPYNPMMSAVLNTPLGDYSGEITVTVRARFSKPFWGDEGSKSGYATSYGTDLFLSAYINGYDNNDYAVTDIPKQSRMGSGRIYEPDGWQEITYQFLNRSANKDSFLSFSTDSAIEIDWIKITDSNTYLACPVVHSPSNFTTEGFTISWDPVRRASGYYIDLYKAVYNTEGALDETCTFEQAALPEWIAAPEGEVAPGEGVDGSAAWLLGNRGAESALTISSAASKLESFSASVKFKTDDSQAKLVIVCEGYTENGWEILGYLQCGRNNVVPGEYNDIGLSDEEFSGKYNQLRLYAMGNDENNQVYLDNLKVFAKAPYTFERVYNENFSACYNPEEEDYPYNFYTFTGSPIDPAAADGYATEYTFTGLDPETDYWYRVRAQNMDQFTIGEKYHAFGVAAPELLPATDITATSYTANWKDVPKAQNYIVTNYKCEVIEKDAADYKYIQESCKNCQGEVGIGEMTPIGNTSEILLDEYMDMKGWIGYNNSVGENKIGGSDYSGAYLITPPIMANDERGTAGVYICVQGYSGDKFCVVGLKSGEVYLYPFEDDGTLVGWFEIPAVYGEQLALFSYYDYPFAISYFDVVQDVKAGDIVKRYDSSAVVPAGVERHIFTDISADMYAYDVVSEYTLQNETTQSVSKAAIYVNEKVNAISEIRYASAYEVARYSVEGLPVQKDYRGLVIIKMSDGSTKKQFIR